MENDTTAKWEQKEFLKEKVSEWGTEGQKKKTKLTTASKGYEKDRRRKPGRWGWKGEQGRGRETVKQLDSVVCLVYRYWEMRFMRV